MMCRRTFGGLLAVSIAATACADGVPLELGFGHPDGLAGNQVGLVDGSIAMMEPFHGDTAPLPVDSGAGGSVGTGGTGGAPGAAGQPGAGGGAAGSPSAAASDGGCSTALCDAGALPMGLKVQYAVGDPTLPSDNQIRPHFQLINDGTEIILLHDLTIRYWYTSETQAEQAGACDTVSFGCGNTLYNTFVALRPARPNADTYYEVAFGSGAGHLHPSQPSGSIELRITRQDGTNYDETNDYSHDAAKTSLALWDKVTLYYRGALVWGVEPSSSTDAGL